MDEMKQLVIQFNSARQQVDEHIQKSSGNDQYDMKHELTKMGYYRHKDACNIGSEFYYSREYFFHNQDAPENVWKVLKNELIFVSNYWTGEGEGGGLTGSTFILRDLTIEINGYHETINISIYNNSKCELYLEDIYDERKDYCDEEIANRINKEPPGNDVVADIIEKFGSIDAFVSILAKLQERASLIAWEEYH